MTKLGDAKALIETTPNQEDRDIMRFLIHSGTAEFAEDLQQRLGRSRLGAVSYLIRAIDEQKHLSRAARKVVAERFLAIPTGEEEFNGIRDLMEVTAGSIIMHRDYPELVATPEQETAILRLSLNLIPSFMSKEPLLIDANDDETGLDLLRIKDHAIIELASRHPHEWGEIADLMLNFGVQRVAELEAMLDGTVISPLMSGVL